MKILLVSLFLSFTLISFSQKPKVDVKKDIVSVNGTPSFQLVNMPNFNGFFLKDMENNKLAIFNMESYRDKNYVNSANPDGKVLYYDVTFMNESMDKCEMTVIGLRKKLAEYLLEYDLIKDGKLNEEAVKQFVKIHGTKFSDEKKHSTTIIINNTK
jgi:hypothetical protein